MPVTQGATPVAYLTSGKRLTATRAAKPPASPCPTASRASVPRMTLTMRRKAAPSMTMAKMGLPIAPWRTGRPRSRASKSLKPEATTTIRTAVFARGETAQAAARKKRAAPVITEPETVEAHWRRYMPSAASESPQRPPRTRTGPQFVFCGD